MSRVARGLCAVLMAGSLSGVCMAADVGRTVPVPQTVSPQMQVLVGAKIQDFWKVEPRTQFEWKSIVTSVAAASRQHVARLREQLGVSQKSGRIGGVPVFVLAPKDMPPAHRDRILLHFHGGGYVLGPGESGLFEAVLTAGLAGFRVVAVDYRMAPEFPYPAAIDDAMAVYRGLLRTTPPEKIGVFGASTGGGMTLVLALRARAEGLPLPAALAAGTPWADLTETGDTYSTSEGLDNVLVSYRGWVGACARAYAAGHDMKDPMLSPVYGDVAGFPPTLLTSGTRDLFLSNTVRMHAKLRAADVPADLLVLEGLSHAQYCMLPDAPETRFYFRELTKFFDSHLK